MNDWIEKAHNLKENFFQLDDLDKFDQPFPIGVFGTLRSIPCDQGNAARMFTKEPIAHRKAFLPHFTSSSIWLNFKEQSSGLIEVFSYAPEDWPAVIKRVDMLEGFYPETTRRNGYWRTLMNVYLLPDDYNEEAFNKGIRHYNDRDLHIPASDWNFTQVPVWVYSSIEENQKAQSLADNPVIWTN